MPLMDYTPVSLLAEYYSALAGRRFLNEFDTTLHEYNGGGRSMNPDIITMKNSQIEIHLQGEGWHIYIRKAVDTASGDYPSITEEVRGAIVGSGVRKGCCVVSLEGASAGLDITSFWDKRGLDNLMDEIGRSLPARVDYYSQTSSFDVSGDVKRAVADGSAVLLVHEGKPVLDSSQGLVLLEFDGSWQRTCHIQVVEAGLELDGH